MHGRVCARGVWLSLRLVQQQLLLQQLQQLQQLLHCATGTKIMVSSNEHSNQFEASDTKKPFKGKHRVFVSYCSAVRACVCVCVSCQMSGSGDRTLGMGLVASAGALLGLLAYRYRHSTSANACNRTNTKRKVATQYLSPESPVVVLEYADLLDSTVDLRSLSALQLFAMSFSFIIANINGSYATHLTRDVFACSCVVGAGLEQ